MNEKLKVTPWDDSALPIATSVALTNGGAAFSYTITKDVNDVYTVVSTGTSGQTQRQVSSTLRLKGVFDDGAILTKGTIKLKPGTTIDGYNSSDSTDTDVDLQIATNSDNPDSIVIGSGSTIDGDIIVDADASFPLVTPPVFTGPDTLNDVKGTTLTISPADNGRYTGINLAKQASPGVLEIEGGDVVLYVTGDVVLGQNCDIIIKTGSSLTLYLDGNFIVGNDAGITNEAQTPSDFILYGTGTDQTINIRAKGDFYGAIYAPDADVIVGASGDIYGSVVCENFELKSGSNFYYDAALRDVGTNDAGTSYVIDRWQE